MAKKKKYNIKRVNYKVGSVNQHGLVVTELDRTKWEVNVLTVCPVCGRVIRSKFEHFNDVFVCVSCKAKMAICKPGEVYDKLTVTRVITETGFSARVRCDCECGNEVELKQWLILSHFATSCGCDNNRKKNSYMGMSKDPMLARLYDTWNHFINRCTSKSNKQYPEYGGRGITVCAMWVIRPVGVLAFIDWALNSGYADDLTIDRRVGHLEYSPENCRWTTKRVQVENRGLSRVNKTGYTGVVRYNQNRFYSKIGGENGPIRLGTFPTPEEATIARNNYIENKDNNSECNIQDLMLNVDLKNALHNGIASTESPFCEWNVPSWFTQYSAESLDNITSNKHYNPEGSYQHEIWR